MKCNLLFELPESSRTYDFFPRIPEEEAPLDLPESMFRDIVGSLPQVSEKEVIRHYNLLASRNFGLDSGPYPLGGHTMRHPPRAGEHISNLEGFREIHPLQDDETIHSIHRIQDELSSWLKDLLGMDELSLEPASEGQAELLGLDLISEYMRSKNHYKNTLLVADDSYFLGDSLAEGLGFRVERIPVRSDKTFHLPDLKGRDDIAALFFSNPNCFGRWVGNQDVIVEKIHKMDGVVVNHARNVAGFLGWLIPGKAKIDMVIFPLGGVFGVPHYGGGPSVVAVGAKKPAAECWTKSNENSSYGSLRSFGVNWPIILRAYIYLSLLGWQGLQRATEDAVLAANYLQERIKVNLAIAGEGRCLNQFAATVPDFLKETGIESIDVARRLLDFGFHGPGIGELPALKDHISFEPTESSTHQILNEMAVCVGQIAIEVARNLPLVKGAPHTTPVAQPKIAEALKEMIVVYTPGVMHTHDIGCGCQLCARKS
jgi:glycine dehydrogenase subunit 2